MSAIRNRVLFWVGVLFFFFATWSRLWGIWFLHDSFDEGQIIQGSHALFDAFVAILQGDFSGIEKASFVSLYGPFPKLLGALPLGLARELFSEHRHVQTVLARILLSFLPNLFTVYLVWRMAQRLSPSPIFRLGALFFAALLFKHCETAHYAVPDSLVTLLALAALDALMRVRLAKKEWAKHYLYAAIGAALAASTKIHVGLVSLGTILLDVLLVSLSFAEERTNERNPFPLSRLLGGWKVIVASLLVFLFTFTLSSLPYLLRWEEWIAAIQTHRYAPFSAIGHPLTYFFMVPPFGIGWTMLLLCFVGLGIGIGYRWRHRHDLAVRRGGKRCAQRGEEGRVAGSSSSGVEIVQEGSFPFPEGAKAVRQLFWMNFVRDPFMPVFLFSLLFYLFLSLAPGAVGRWIIPLLPPLALFGAVTFRHLDRGIAPRLPTLSVSLRYALLFLLALFLAYEPAYHLVRFNLNLAEKPTTYDRVSLFLLEVATPGKVVGPVLGPFRLPQGFIVNEVPSEEDLQGGRYSYALFSDFFFEEGRGRFPPFLRWPDREWDQWVRIRREVESQWHFVARFASRYATPWGDPIAKQQVFTLYRHPSALSEE